jgi:glucosamine-6-phosphate deaminase
MSRPTSRHPDQAKPLRIRVFSAANDVDAFAAREIAELVQARATSGKPCVLGLAAGSTPIAVYRMLVRFYGQGLSFANVVTFNLDEYYPMQPSSPHSYTRFMRENFLNHVDLDPARVHVLDASLQVHRVAEHCEHYEQAIAAAGGIDLQLLGIGRNGHIGFNEPGSPRTSRTRLVTLDEATRRDAQRSFGEDEVPRQAITMGIGSILRARGILLLAVGSHKAAIIAKAVQGAVTAEVPASFLQGHANASVCLDRSAAESLSRVTQTYHQATEP